MTAQRSLQRAAFATFLFLTGCEAGPLGTRNGESDGPRGATVDTLIYSGPTTGIGSRRPSFNVAATAGAGVTTSIPGADITRTADSTFTNVTFERVGHLVPLAGLNLAGASFPGWLTFIDHDSLKSIPGYTGPQGGNIANEPSPSTIAAWYCSGPTQAKCVETDYQRDIVFSRPIARVDLRYAARLPTRVEIYGPDNALLGTQELPATLVYDAAGKLTSVNPAGDNPSDPGTYRVWYPLKVERPDNLISKIRLIGTPNMVGIDSYEFVAVNYAPTASAGGPYLVNEGTQLELNGTLSFDPINAQGQSHANGDPIVEYLWDLGGGVSVTGPKPKHVFTTSGSRTVSLTVRDPNLVWSPTAATATVLVNNVAPTVLAGGDVALADGVFSLSRTGSFTDPGTEPQGWTATADYGDGGGPKPLTLNADRTFSLSHVYGASGVYNVTVAVSDGEIGGTGSATFKVTVANRSPAIGSLASATINEGGTYTATGTFTDPDANQWIASVDYGDGTPAGPLTLAANKSFSLSHQYRNEGTYTVKVTVSDQVGAPVTTLATVTVLNVAPTIAPIAGVVATVGVPWSTNVIFTDPGADSWTATVDYGSGPVNLGAVSSGFSIGGTYMATGARSVSVTISDGTVTSTRTFSVAVQPVLSAATIEIRPESVKLNGCSDTDTVDGDGCGMLTVFVSRSVTFDPRTADPLSLRLGNGDGVNEVAVARDNLNRPMVQVTGNALIAKFRRSDLLNRGELPTTAGVYSLFLEGSPIGNSAVGFRGSDTVRIIP